MTPAASPQVLPPPSRGLSTRRGAAAVLLVLLLAGCRSDDLEFPRIVNEPAPLSAGVRATFGRVGILPVAGSTNVQFAQPLLPPAVSQKLAYRNYLQMQRATRNYEGRYEDEAARIGFNALVTSPLSGLEGVAGGITADQLALAQQALKSGFDGQSLELAIQRELDRIAARRPVAGVSLLPESVLGDIKVQRGRPDFSALKARDIDSVLDIRVAEVGFEYQRGSNPDLTFTPQILAYVIRVADGAVLHASYLDYRGTRHTLGGWAEADARAFRIEVNLAARTFVESLIDQYFGIAPSDVRKLAPAE